MFCVIKKRREQSKAICLILFLTLFLIYFEDFLSIKTHCLFDHVFSIKFSDINSEGGVPTFRKSDVTFPLLPKRKNYYKNISSAFLCPFVCFINS